MTIDSTLQVRINGEHRRVEGGITVAELVREIGFDPVRVAVERNLEVVPRSTLPAAPTAPRSRRASSCAISPPAR